MSMQAPTSGQCPWRFLSDISWDLSYEAAERWYAVKDTDPVEAKFWWDLARRAEDLHRHMCDFSDTVRWVKRTSWTTDEPDMDQDGANW